MARDVDTLLVKASRLHLAQNPEWLNLVHFRATLTPGFESQVDDPKFFLAKDGKYSPESELRESIIQLFSKTAVSDSHPRCHFVARYYWLAEKLDIDDPNTSACAEYHKWLTEINPKSALLVFPASYLNSPSSMFGHTLLRLDPGDYRKDIPLASYAVNFAAQVQASKENGFLYVYRGLFGGYPGKFNIVPYHEKIKEYNDLENRDIWEYSLNLTDAEILRMMRHLWELKSIRIDYFFTSENCSYQLLSLLDVARPGLRLAGNFSWRTIPVDTIRTVIDAGLVRQVGYRSSQSKLLLQRYRRLPEKLKRQVKLLTRPDIGLEENLDTSLSPRETAQVLEESYDFLRFQATSVRALHKPQYQKSYQLLKQRSLIKTASVWPAPSMPKIRSDQSHGSSRVATGYGKFLGKHYWSFKYRPAYHQQLDPGKGFDYGSAINFLDVDIRYGLQSKRLQLNSINIVNIESMTPVNGLFSPWSWMVNVENRKTAISESQLFNVFQLNADFGKTYAIDETNKHALSLFLDNQLYTNRHLERKGGLGIGPRLYFRSNVTKFAFVTDLSWRKTVVGESLQRKNAYIGVSKYWNENTSLRIHWRREMWDDTGSTELEISGHYYF